MGVAGILLLLGFAFDGSVVPGTFISKPTF